MSPEIALLYDIPGQGENHVSKKKKKKKKKERLNVFEEIVRTFP